MPCPSALPFCPAALPFLPPRLGGTVMPLCPPLSFSGNPTMGGCCHALLPCLCTTCHTMPAHLLCLLCVVVSQASSKSALWPFSVASWSLPASPRCWEASDHTSDVPGICAIPGAFGCGKTVISQALSKYNNRFCFYRHMCHSWGFWVWQDRHFPSPLQVQ